MAKNRSSKRDKTHPLGKNQGKKVPRKPGKKTAPLMNSEAGVDVTVTMSEPSDEASESERDADAEARKSKQKKKKRKQPSSVPPPSRASDPGDTEDARKERRQRRLDAQLIAALYNTTDEEMTRFRRLRLGRDSQAPLDALMRGRELLEVLVEALRAGDDADAWDDLDLALRTARGQGAAENLESLPQRQNDTPVRNGRAPLVSARPTPAQINASTVQEAWSHHQMGHGQAPHAPAALSHVQPSHVQSSHAQPSHGQSSHAQPSHPQSSHVQSSHAQSAAAQSAAQSAAAQSAAVQSAAAHASSTQPIHGHHGAVQPAQAQHHAARAAAAHQHAAQAAQQQAAQHQAAQQAAQQQAAQQQAAQAAQHQAAQQQAAQAAQHQAAQQQAAQAAQHQAAQQQAAQQQAAQQQAAQQQAAQQQAHAAGHHSMAQGGPATPGVSPHAPMSTAQHTQRSAWGQAHWGQGYGPGQAYAPGSLPQQTNYASPPPGYTGQGQAGQPHPGATAASNAPTGAAGTGGGLHPPQTGQVPIYPVHGVGTPAPGAAAYPEFGETAAHVPVDLQGMPEVETREPTPPLFKPLANKTMVAPTSTRGGTMPPGPATIPPPAGTMPPSTAPNSGTIPPNAGTIPPSAGTDPPPPNVEEPAPQSQTSPNTPLPDPSPSPPPAEAAAPHPEVTPPARSGDDLAEDLEEDAEARGRAKRPFVEDGKTTQLSFTSAAHPFALSVEQYAGLCAERDACGDDAERERKIHKRYEIGDKRARSLVDRLFKMRFEEAPELEESWGDHYARFKIRLEQAADEDAS